MSKERVFKIVMDFGLSETDAQVYVYLALNGPHKAKELTGKIELYKEQLYRFLKNLKEKDIVKASYGYPAEFSAIPFEKVLDKSAEIKREQVDALTEINKYLMSNWESLFERIDN